MTAHHRSKSKDLPGQGLFGFGDEGGPPKSKRRSPIPDTHKDDLARRYQAGESMKSLSEEFSHNIGSIKEWLIERRVHIRDMATIKRTCTLRQNAFDVITEESAYWIGFLMADGCVAKPRKTFVVYLSLKERDSEHIKKFRDFLGSSHKLSFQANNRGFSAKGDSSMARIAVTSDRLAASLARYGVVPKKSRTAKVIGLATNKHFWRGVVDGDGCLGTAKGSPVLELVGSQSIVNQFKEFVLLHCPNYEGTSRLSRSAWCLRLSTSSAMKMIEILYADCSIALERKMKIARHFLDNPYVRKLQDRSHLTLDYLQSLYDEHGMWKKVAVVVGMSPQRLATHLFELRVKAKMIGPTS
jgi:hypothetical protein